jgi:hypothetical protein
VSQRKLGQIRGGQAAKLALLGGVDLGLGRKEVACGTGFHLDDYDGVSVPGDEVEIAADAIGDPAAGHNGVAECAELKKGEILAAFAGEEMRRFRPLAGAGGAIRQTAVAERAQAKVGAPLEGQEAGSESGDQWHEAFA